MRKAKGSGLWCLEASSSHTGGHRATALGRCRGQRIGEEVHGHPELRVAPQLFGGWKVRGQEGDRNKSSGDSSGGRKVSMSNVLREPGGGRGKGTAVARATTLLGRLEKMGLQRKSQS